MKEAAVAFPGIALQLQQLQLASGWKEVWQQCGQLVALQIKVGEVWGALKEASTKVSESVEREIKTSQRSQVVQLVTLQPREEVVAEDMLKFFTVVTYHK